MTTSGISHQGEGQSHCEAGRPYPAAAHHEQTLIVPPLCVVASVAIHQHAGDPRYCLALEVGDAHTKELLYMHVNPTGRASMVRTIAAAASLDLRHALEAVLDPDPF